MIITPPNKLVAQVHDRMLAFRLMRMASRWGGLSTNVRLRPE
jgi:hypothetical protein